MKHFAQVKRAKVPGVLFFRLPEDAAGDAATAPASADADAGDLDAILSEWSGELLALLRFASKSALSVRALKISGTPAVLVQWTAESIDPASAGSLLRKRLPVVYENSAGAISHTTHPSAEDVVTRCTRLEARMGLCSGCPDRFPSYKDTESVALCFTNNVVPYESAQMVDFLRTAHGGITEPRRDWSYYRTPLDLPDVLGDARRLPGYAIVRQWSHEPAVVELSSVVLDASLVADKLEDRKERARDAGATRSYAAKVCKTCVLASRTGRKQLPRPCSASRDCTAPATLEHVWAAYDAYYAESADQLENIDGFSDLERDFLLYNMGRTYTDPDALFGPRKKSHTVIFAGFTSMPSRTKVFRFVRAGIFPLQERLFSEFSELCRVSPEIARQYEEYRSHKDPWRSSLRLRQAAAYAAFSYHIGKRGPTITGHGRGGFVPYSTVPYYASLESRLIEVSYALQSRVIHVTREVTFPTEMYPETLPPESPYRVWVLRDYAPLTEAEMALALTPGADVQEHLALQKARAAELPERAF